MPARRSRWSCSWQRIGIVERRRFGGASDGRTAVQRKAWKTRKSRLMWRDSRDGRCKARTCDPQLVELDAFRSTMLLHGLVGQDLGHAHRAHADEADDPGARLLARSDETAVWRLQPQFFGRRPQPRPARSSAAGSDGAAILRPAWVSNVRNSSPPRARPLRHKEGPRPHHIRSFSRLPSRGRRRNPRSRTPPSRMRARAPGDCPPSARASCGCSQARRLRSPTGEAGPTATAR